MAKEAKKKRPKKVLFKDYLDSLCLNQDSVAYELGKARCTVNRWYNGKTTPSRDDAIAINIWSGDRVKISEWNYS